MNGEPPLTPPTLPLLKKIATRPIGPQKGPASSPSLSIPLRSPITALATPNTRFW